MKDCTKCNGTFKWKQPYDGTKIPEGDNPCTCNGPKSSPATSAPRVEVPIEQIVAEITAIKGTMVIPTVDGLETVKTECPLSPEMVEGIWKYAISRKMSR
jgi:hypothetical protein